MYNLFAVCYGWFYMGKPFYIWFVLLGGDADIQGSSISLSSWDGGIAQILFYMF